MRERERYRREREKDGSDVTIVALKLAMSFALLLAKNVHLIIGGAEALPILCVRYIRAFRERERERERKTEVTSPLSR